MSQDCQDFILKVTTRLHLAGLQQSDTTKQEKISMTEGVSEALSNMKYECGKCPSVFKQP